MFKKFFGGESAPLPSDEPIMPKLPNQPKSNEVPINLDFQSSEYSAEVRSQIGAVQYIVKCLKLVNPDVPISESDISLAVKDDSGRVPHTSPDAGRDRGGWDRHVFYSASFEGQSVENCEVEAYEGLTDNGAQLGWWAVRRK